MLHKNGRVLWIVAGLILLVPRPARGADEVSGSFTVKGKTTTFRLVYCYWKPNFFDQAKKDLFVLLSDAPIPSRAIPKVAVRSAGVRITTANPPRSSWAASSSRAFAC
jgi:hypothetical protein